MKPMFAPTLPAMTARDSSFIGMLSCYDRARIAQPGITLTGPPAYYCATGIEAAILAAKLDQNTIPLCGMLSLSADFLGYETFTGFMMRVYQTCTFAALLQLCVFSLAASPIVPNNPSNVTLPNLDPAENLTLNLTLASPL
ncbi:MAG: hypothetical protein Q9175_001982, partial [Cornicularia normoerica]